MIKDEMLSKLTENLSSFKFSLLPTPLHELNILGKELGIKLFCKRDDLTGFAFGGNKTRKLDYLIKDASESGADCIVTFGANQSNWCRMTSAAAGKAGLETFLVLSGSKPDKPTGNLILNELTGANMYHISSDSEDEIIGKCNSLVSDLKAKGRKPYYIGVGGSNPVGCTGYIRALGEIISYEQSTGINFSRIFVASGSAGTQAGLVAAKLISGWEGSVIGISVMGKKTGHEIKVEELVKDTLLLHGISLSRELIKQSVIVDDSYLGGGYRLNTPGCLEAIRMFASREGIFLDQVYTGKAAAALIDYARKGDLGINENILFLHTGGAIQLFE